MKKLITIPFALAITLAGAQTTNQSQIRHVETSLNHLTVLEFGEPVTTLAVADPDSFMVERHDDKVFVMPLREKVSTNLFVWTASRQLSYELDPAGQLAAMDVLIRNEPPVDPHTSLRASAETTDEEIRKIASLVLTQTMMGVQDIARDPAKPAKDRIQIDLEQVYRSKDQLYIRYSVTNQTRSPFRLTTPDVSAPLPTQQPISL
ncbi:MAG: TrbG/VirB9 family P-type conjugative transfer protein, partial [Silvibacterium sp.]